MNHSLHQIHSPCQPVGHEILHATAHEQLFSRAIDSRINWNIHRQYSFMNIASLRSN